MERAKYIYGVLFTLIGALCENLEDQCQTQSGANGTCIHLLECDYLSKILSESHITPSDRDYLRRSQCGHVINSNGRKTSKVCCAPDTRFAVSDLPSPGICGSSIHNNRVTLGGVNASITDSPWMALLQYTKDGVHSFNCGGVVINQNYIVTAAHCVSGKKLINQQLKITSVRLGEQNLLTEIDCDQEECADPVENIPVAETIVHENFNASSLTKSDDIALIRLTQSIRFTQWIKPICLPVTQDHKTRRFDGKSLTLHGFGRTENGSTSNVKQRLELIGFNLNQCNNIYRSLNINLTQRQLCAGGEKAKDACNGDSGRPLMYLDDNGTTFLAGIVSFGPRSCGTEGWPGVYTRISKYIGWILNHMRH